MKNIFKNLILLIVLIATTQNSFGYVLTSNELNNIATKKLEIETKNKLKQELKDSDIKITISQIPFETIITQGNSVPKIEISPVSTIQSNSFRKVTIKNPDNSIAKSFGLTIQTQIYKEVLVATQNIQFNQEITKNNTKIEKSEISKNILDVCTKFESGMISKRNYQKGNIISSNGIKNKSIILKNSLIDIVFLSNGIKIKLQGYALKDGNIGDTILVRSDKYNKVYNAIVNSANEVTVRI